MVIMMFCSKGQRSQFKGHMERGQFKLVALGVDYRVASNKFHKIENHSFKQLQETNNFLLGLQALDQLYN